MTEREQTKPPTSVKPRPGASPKSKLSRDPAPELPAVIGGRFLAAAAMIGALTLIPMSKLGDALEPREPPRSDTANWVIGKTSTVRLTLVTADYAALSCAHDQAVEGKHCVNKSETEAWPRDPNQPLDDNKANVIQPYRTWLDNKLILVAGLWATPPLAMRLHREPPGNLLPEKLARFVTECRVRFVAEFDRPKLRWSQGQGWGADPNTPKVPVAIPESCEIIEEPSQRCPEGLICKVLEAL